jgi:single-stranded-DNA-specific exonuclease
LLNYKLIGDNDYVFDVQGTILKNRGLEGKDLLNLDKKVEIPYIKLRNIDKAVECASKHIDECNNILIVTDEDMDGYSSSAIMYQYLKMIDEDLNVKWVIHEEKTHGLKGIEIPKDIDLVIIPDSSSNEFEYHKDLKDRGIDVVILDHHEVEEESKFAIVVNPQLGGYPNLNLSAAGVVYKFCQALDDHYWNDHADYFLDLVALGNIADSMSMAEEETRYYVEKGLKNINNDFFRSLLNKQQYSIGGKMNPISISFFISPLVNAVIRVGTIEEKTNLYKALIGHKELVKYKPRGSDEILVPFVDDMARQCVNIRNRQKRIVDKAVKEIEEIIESKKLYKNKVIFIDKIDTEIEGLTGLIGNKISPKYKKPSLILSGKNEKGFYKGSGRGYDKGELKNFREIVVNSGVFEMAKGHLSAFGIEISEDNIEEVNNRLNKELESYNFEDSYEVDFLIPAESMNDYIVSEIDEMENLWGKNIDEPFLLIEKIPVNDSDLSLIGKKENTISIYYNGIKYMIFNTDEEALTEIKSSKYINVIGKANMNVYKDEKNPQLIVELYELN